MIRMASATLLATSVALGAAHAANGDARTQRLEKTFARFDASGDGVVDRSELSRVFAKRFAKRDANKDGVLDANERKAALSRLEGRKLEAGEERFRRADANGDGKLSREEFLAMTPPWFERADVDRDEKLTKAELEAFAAERRSPKQGGGAR